MAHAAAPAARPSFFGDFVSGWSWSLRKPLFVTVMVAAALLNFGVNGVEYAIQLHLMQFNTDATLIGAIGSGIAAMMLVGAFAAARLSDRVPVGVCICVSFVFLCACVAPMLFAYGPGVSDGAARLSDRVPVGVCICVSFVFLCACVAPMLFAYGPGVSDGASYALVFVANSVMGLPFPIIDALLLGFVYAKAPTSMQGRIAVSLIVPAPYALVFVANSVMGLPFPIIDALLLGFVYAKAPTSMQGRIAVSLIVPALGFRGTILLLGFVYAKAPTSMQGRIAVSLIVPALGFRGTIAVFLATLALSAVMVLCSARIRRIPRADGWDTAEL